MVIDVEETSHRGQVYEQYVVAQTPEGETFGLFDPDMLIPSSISAKRFDVLIGLLVDQDGIKHSLSNSDSPEIIPSSDNPHGAEGHRYRGEVVTVEPTTESVMEIHIDIGHGTVAFRAPIEEVSDITLNELLGVEATRSDIWDVTPIEDTCRSELSY